MITKEGYDSGTSETNGPKIRVLPYECSSLEEWKKK